MKTTGDHRKVFTHALRSNIRVIYNYLRNISNKVPPIKIMMDQ